MKYCGDCGAPIVERIPLGDNRLRPVCSGCGTVHYINPRVLVGCVVHVGDKMLVVRRAHPPSAGLWSSPSGFMEQGESLEQAAARETFEEAGVKVDPALLELYSIVSLPELSQIYVYFRIELDAIPEMRAGPECLEVKMIRESEIELSQVAFPVMVGEDSRKSILFREIRSGAFAIHKLCVERGAVRLSGHREYHVGGSAIKNPVISEVVTDNPAPE